LGTSPDRLMIEEFPARLFVSFNLTADPEKMISPKPA
jgi:hypothetical protein